MQFCSLQESKQDLGINADALRCTQGYEQVLQKHAGRASSREFVNWVIYHRISYSKVHIVEHVYTLS